MELLKVYQEYIKKIDEIKEEKLQRGLSNKCKTVIDDVYSKIAGREGELEVELYKRKSDLQNDIKIAADFKYDHVMSGTGAFLGIVIGYFFQELVQTFTEIYISIKEGTFFKAIPLEILNDKSVIGESVILFLTIGIGVYILYKKDDTNKNDEKRVFQVDMGNYEIKKIDELLEKL